MDSEVMVVAARLELNTSISKDDNISKQKISAINSRLTELHGDIACINEEIISLNETIREKYEKQQDFINIAAHEIRSPYQAIIGYVELLNLEPINRKKYFDLIAKNAEMLSLLISNILDD